MTDNRTDDPEVQREQPFVSHLLELRDRMMRIVVVVLVVFVGLFYFAPEIYTMTARPLLQQLPEGSRMISVKPHGTFWSQMKLVLVISVYVGMPFILYQIWGFIAPGLYRHERRLAVPLLASSTVLFYAGMAFAYYVVFPLMFGFFISVAPSGVEVATDVNEYLDFVLKIFFAFGIAFEVPIATILLVWTGFTTPESLREKRPYIILGTFVIGMLLTPPDLISQTLLALPMWVLFEIGVFFAARFAPRAADDENDEEEADDLDSDEAMDAALDRYVYDEEALAEEERASGVSKPKRDRGDDA
nr:twin-arginine translocase subunit TatC [Thiohalomonas denitrificans]